MAKGKQPPKKEPKKGKNPFAKAGKADKGKCPKCGMDKKSCKC